MKKIDFKVAGKKYRYSVPEGWDEVTPEQLKLWVKHNGELNVGFIMPFMGLADVVSVNLQPTDWWTIIHEFDWMNDTDGIRRLIIDELAMPDGKIYYGYNPDFSDVTWEEWTFADTYAAAERWDVVLAVLYRPERENWDHETDRRIPFTKYGTELRMEQTAKLDKETVEAAIFNFKVLRKRMTDHYSHLFYEQVEEEGGRKRKKLKQTTDWLKLIRNMMGENFYEEQKYLNLSVPSVLFQLETRVKEAQNHGK